MGAEGKSDELKGRAKEALGAVTGDDDLAREGRSDQRRGAAEQAVDKVRDAAEKAKDALKK
jgi:uncharacterized protein YjbJ (UPF0337 family)